MKNTIFPVIALFFLIGCSTIKDAEQKLGTAEEHVYEQIFSALWLDVIDVIEESDLDLVYADRGNGNILAQAPISAFSWGGNVYIKISKISNARTMLKVSSVRASPTNITATNWEKYIVNKLDNVYFR